MFKKLSKIVCATLLVIGAGAGVDAVTAASTPQPHHRLIQPPTQDTRPNIVFVLTDDLSSGLINYMPNVQKMIRHGMSFTNYTVTDSLCCPSRTSIFTGEFPHTHGVVGNTLAENGGYQEFQLQGDQNRTFAVSLQNAGYQTAFVGKYLNRLSKNDTTGPNTWTQLGWDWWAAIDGGGYHEYNYNLMHNNSVEHFGSAPRDYGTTVERKWALKFLQSNAAASAPFMLEVAPFAPHEPYVPAPRDQGTMANIPLPHGRAYDTLPKNAPYWLAQHPALTQADMAREQRAFTKRVEDVQSVDRMIGALRKQLAAQGKLGNTVFVFSSDNGYHLGQYRLVSGKETAFDTDVNVPLIVTGPHIAAGTVNHNLTENIDLAPTFERLANASVPGSTVEGRSLVPLLHGRSVSWRTVSTIEHTHPVDLAGDPDAQSYADGTPPTYVALRGVNAHGDLYTYVQYHNGQREYYDLTNDPHELNNIYGSLNHKRITHLEGIVQRMESCTDAATCWHAANPVASSLTTQRIH